MAVKYLVSGGEGALGKTVISMLLQRGEKVRILMSELSDTRIYRNNPNIEICYGISVTIRISRSATVFPLTRIP